MVKLILKGISMALKSTRKQRNRMMQKLERFAEDCRGVGLKVTPQRIAVYKLLAESQEHPSAETVWRSLRRTYPHISLDTVNRNLLTFVEMGLASMVEGSGEVRRYDGDLDNHQHFRCVKCRKIFDFHHEPFDDIKLPASISSKFKVLRKTLYLEGICDACRRKSRS